MMMVQVRDAGRSECSAVMVEIEVAKDSRYKMLSIKITSSASCADFRWMEPITPFRQVLTYEKIERMIFNKTKQKV